MSSAALFLVAALAASSQPVANAASIGVASEFGQ
jgi:hypothetical protein